MSSRNLPPYGLSFAEQVSQLRNYNGVLPEGFQLPLGILQDIEVSFPREWLEAENVLPAIFCQHFTNDYSSRYCLEMFIGKNCYGASEGAFPSSVRPAPSDWVYPSEREKYFVPGVYAVGIKVTPYAGHMGEQSREDRHNRIAGIELFMAAALYGNLFADFLAKSEISSVTLDGVYFASKNNRHHIPCIVRDLSTGRLSLGACWSETPSARVAVSSIVGAVRVKAFR